MLRACSKLRDQGRGGHLLLQLLSLCQIGGVRMDSRYHDCILIFLLQAGTARHAYDLLRQLISLSEVFAPSDGLHVPPSSSCLPCLWIR